MSKEADYLNKNLEALQLFLPFKINLCFQIALPRIFNTSVMLAGTLIVASTLKTLTRSFNNSFRGLVLGSVNSKIKKRGINFFDFDR